SNKNLLNRIPTTKVLPKESQPTKPEDSASPGYKTIGTGFTSTLLSSQRTTTHQPNHRTNGNPTGATSLSYLD
ncbi:hypothetical protein ACFUYE_32475, partial [Micromonospora humida]|uniref:hypothetical protein n=1 Tax=Micromonospora humida TaxID=2809018 RepID=UPI00366C4231